MVLLWPALCALLGCGLHFLYDALGRPRLLAPVLAVNESIWEHTKLLAAPALLLALPQARLLELPAGVLAGANCAALAISIPVMVLGYCFWVTAIGPHGLWVGIGDFLLAVAAHYWALDRMLEQGITAPLWPLGLCYLVWTYAPPRLPLFWDPAKGGYGEKRT